MGNISLALDNFTRGCIRLSAIMGPLVNNILTNQSIVEYLPFLIMSDFISNLTHFVFSAPS